MELLGAALVEALAMALDLVIAAAQVEEAPQEILAGARAHSWQQATL